MIPPNLRSFPVLPSHKFADWLECALELKADMKVSFLLFLLTSMFFSNLSHSSEIDVPAYSTSHSIEEGGTNCLVSHTRHAIVDYKYQIGAEGDLHRGHPVVMIEGFMFPPNAYDSDQHQLFVHGVWIDDDEEVVEFTTQPVKSSDGWNFRALGLFRFNTQPGVGETREYRESFEPVAKIHRCFLVTKNRWPWN